MKLPYKLHKKMDALLECVCNFWNNKMEIIIYTFLTIIGISCIIIATSLDGYCVGIFSGLGTGVISSLIVSLIISNTTTQRIIKEKNAAKKFIFSKMLLYATHVYSILIYKINEFCLFSGRYSGRIYELYDDFKKYYDFEKTLKTINYDESDPKLKEQLNNLFDFPKYDILMLASEIKHFPKQELYIQGIINQDDYKSFVDEYARDEYLKNVNDMNDFKSENIVDYGMCIKFMTRNIWLCSKIIKLVGNARTIHFKEENIKDALNEKYFNEVEIDSDRYIEWEIQQAEIINEYYNEHPELIEEAQAAWEAEENETPTEKNLSALSYHIFEMYWGSPSIEEILNNLNPEDKVVRHFFDSNNVKMELKKKRKIRKIINKVYGKKYLTDLWKESCSK